ncbi:MAG: nitroreductase family protein [Bacteroidaceae bacterium]|nr:nitroreductase family protein [Bacteroidaceae bacterium]
MKRILLLGHLAMALCLICGCGDKQSASVQGFDDVVASRRSIRDYDASKSISQEEVMELIKCAQEAPSWANQQPTKYYVAMTPEKVAAVKELVGDGNKRNTAGAPVMIVSTYIKGRSGFFRSNPANEIGDGWGAYDNGLSNAYFILKARERGFDTLIMGMRDSDALRKLFAIPDDECIMAVISLGYRASDPNRPDRKSVSEVVKFF